MRLPGASISGLRTSASWKLKSFTSGPREENNATWGAELNSVGAKPSAIPTVAWNVVARPAQSLVVEEL